MAKKITTIEEESPAATEFVSIPEVDAEDEATPEDIQVRELLDTFGGKEGVTVHIYRQGARGIKDMTLLAQCTPEEFDPIMLASEPYNGGTFRIHVRSAGGLSGNRVLKVAPAAALKPIAGDSQSIAGLEKLAAAMTQGFAQLAELMLRQQGQPNPLQSLDGIVSIIERLKPAAPAIPANGDLGSQLGMFTKFVELSKLLNPPASAKMLNDDGDVNPNMLLMKGLEVFGDAIGKGKAAEQVQGSPALAARAGAVPVPVQSSPEDEDMMFFKMQLKMANKAAANGSDAADFADSIYKLIPDDVLATLANDAQWFEYLKRADAGVAQHEAWYAQVRATLIEYMREDGLTNSVESPMVAGAQPADPAASANGDHPGGTPAE